MGADYWVDQTVGYAAGNNDGITLGRFKYVTKEWRAFNSSNLPAEEMRRNPPPLN